MTTSSGLPVGDQVRVKEWTGSQITVEQERAVKFRKEVLNHALMERDPEIRVCAATD